MNGLRSGVEQPPGHRPHFVKQEHSRFGAVGIDCFGVNEEPQVAALVWFLDEFPHGDQWDWFSLSERPGRLVDAAEEFDRLLREP